MYSLIVSLVRREVAGRYRGSVLGMLWPLLTPLFMLVVYTFVFGYVMKSKWQVPGVTQADHSTAEFAVILFAGLLINQLFSEVLNAAPGRIVGHSSYVKKIVFPIQILPVVSVGAALFHVALSLLVLLTFVWFVFGGIPWTAVLAPVVILPLAVLTLGLAWFLSAIGVYFRDIGQIVPPLLTASMFLSPMFFSRTALPDWLQPYLALNPLTIPIEALRDVAVFGLTPNWTALGYYSLVALVVAVLGEQFFQKTRRGFADVL